MSTLRVLPTDHAARTLYDLSFRHPHHGQISGRELAGFFRFGGPEKLSELLTGLQSLVANDPSDETLSVVAYTLGHLVDDVFTCADDPSAKDWLLTDASSSDAGEGA